MSTSDNSKKGSLDTLAYSNRDLKNSESSDSDYSEDTDIHKDNYVLDAVYSEIPDLELPEITSEVPEEPTDAPDNSVSGKPYKNGKQIDVNWDALFPGEDPNKIETYKDSKGAKLPPIAQSAKDLVNKYLATPENLGIHKRSKYIRELPRDPVDFNLLFDQNSFTPVDTEIKAVRHVATGEIIDYMEEDLPSEDEGETLSMNRPPLPLNISIRGSTDQYPFMPGGFEEELQNVLKQTEGYTETANIDLNFKDEPGKYLGEDLSLTIPGLDDLIFGTKNKCDKKVQEKDISSLNFGYQTNEEIMRQYHNFIRNEVTQDTVKEDVEIVEEKVVTEDLTVNKAKLIEATIPKEAHIEEINQLENNYKDIGLDETYSNDKFYIKDFWKRDEETEDTSKSVDDDKDKCLGRAIKEDTSFQTLPERPVLMISNAPIQTGATSTEWAEIIDVTLPVPEFDNIKQKAHTYPFELDNFQKQAILKLELGHHVFVAAHTSAGKTVVAEYAIAMARKNYTRTIYTSPIKALSNQKFNDFNRTFGDVGLLTGDLQLNPKAACLVMTTEILRSMLYCGSDVTRDLEFVIFDEVHYINNSERGYVWEEALILLPAHVKIIMLSATVPNTLQFADWVGRTKRRKVYVVSTLKRPVPLCHYLYTGSGGKSKDERFLFLDQNGQFLLRGYNEAVAAKKSRGSDHKKNFGPKGSKQFLNPKTEQTIWIGFIDHLKRNDKLPVVAFTLSRHRCDMNAENLMSVDLTTAKEKSYIRSFFQRCLHILNEPDRQLPQVLNLQRVLENGIGVHHSGILPLLKEIVEMLFQSGHVKILFATETFAMGVNMPTRTVVFDSVTKFDGQEMRPLLPAEYIQMAGRAGRRGLDDTGTVIIMCKEVVPDIVTLKSMTMCVPQRLSSQFRLTYSMILSLLRAPTVTVEAMMKRSFREFNQILQADKYKKQLEMAEKEYSEKCEVPLAPHLAALVEFYDVAYEYIAVHSEMMPILLNQFRVAKEMVAGRVLIISAGPYINQLAVYLNFNGPSQTPLKVLVLDTPIKDDTKYNFDLDEDWYRMLGFSVHYETVGTEEATLKHTILCIAHKNVVAVTKTIFKIEADSIILDWERRQIPRMKDFPVEAKCASAVSQLSQLSHATYLSATELERIDLLQNLNVSSGEILNNVEKINSLSRELEKLKKCTDVANFMCEFAIVYERKLVQLKRDKFKYLLSSESLALYPEYQRRLMILKELNYINDKHGVILKGRVACSMGTNELLLSELIFQNVFTDKTPAEIAALLSCFVFQAKTMNEPQLTDSLKEGLTQILRIDHELTSLETKYMINNLEGLPNNINSGLIGVVYEWAEGRPFANIMSLIDVQEGIIVRCIQQLNEVLVDMKNAAEIVGDTTLRSKMMQASLAIKRDIVFAASLYTSPED